MPTIIQYLLKLSLSVAIIHSFYFLVLRRLTFYNLNRWYLSGYALLCFIIPFINVSRIADKADEKLPVLNYIPSVQNITIHIPATISQPTQPAWSVWDLVIVLLAIGSIIMLLKFVVQMISFIRLKQKAEVLSDNGAVIYHVNEQIMPFSFGDSIYLNKNSHTDNELQEIIMHEYVHVKQRHTIDILIAELLCMINWYNPFAWFMRHSIRQNLEFIADDNVVRNGINKKDYQYHLLKVVGIPQYRIANQFNFSSLKKRIIMMNQQKSAKIHLLKFMFILPLLAVTLLACRSELANAMVKVKNMPQAMHLINKVYPAVSKSSQVANTKTKETPETIYPNEVSIAHSKTMDVTAFSTGDVVTTKEISGTSLIIVKHGELFDAYSNLTSVNVKKGDKVNKGQVIGTVDLDTTGKPALIYDSYKGVTRIGGNDTTVLYSTVIDKGKGTINSSSDIRSATGLTNIASNNSGAGDISVSAQPGDAHGLTTASSGNGSKAVTYLAGNIRYINIANDPNEVTFTIDPQHIDESQFESMKKRFADSGFDLKIKADVKQGKAQKLNISIYGSQKDNSSSAVYTASDITDNDKFIIKIVANKKTGSVSINTFSEADAPK